MSISDVEIKRRACPGFTDAVMLGDQQIGNIFRSLDDNRWVGTLDRRHVSRDENRAVVEEKIRDAVRIEILRTRSTDEYRRVGCLIGQASTPDEVAAAVRNAEDGYHHGLFGEVALALFKTAAVQRRREMAAKG